MKKTPARKTSRRSGADMRAEYKFNYSKAEPNRFALRVDKGRLVVALDPDVSDVFTTPEAVNKVSRALIDAMPAATHG